MSISYTDNKTVVLTSAPQTLTGVWADLGDIINCMDMKNIALWLDLDINDSLDVRVRFLCKRTIDDVESYSFPIRAVSAGVVAVAAEYFELSNDADQKIVIPCEAGDLVPFIQVQVMAGTPGVTPGEITKSAITFESRR